MDTAHRAALGRAGEDLAVRLVVGDGLEVLDRNWRDGRRGELDVVARDPGTGTVVFVEVRTRTGDGHGTALESVDARKLMRLRSLAAAWLSRHDVHGRVRMDVIAVTVPPVARRSDAPRPVDLGGARVEWVRGIVP